MFLSVLKKTSLSDILACIAAQPTNAFFFGCSKKNIEGICLKQDFTYNVIYDVLITYSLCCGIYLCFLIVSNRVHGKIRKIQYMSTE